jgi:dTDP-4-amino-4,6-dideoxygalactose transaminase
MIKMYDFKKQYNSIKNQIDNSIQNVLNDSAFSNGKYVQGFENEFSSYIGSEYCVAVNNGTSALHAALLAINVGKNDEVLVPSFSFFATCESVSLTGATPIFVDSDYNNFNLNINDLESKITNKTKAIICVHLYGQPCDMDELQKISKKYNLHLIEDAAQAHGSEYKNHKVGSFGDFACFSFYPTKNLGAYGEGGAILTNSKDSYNKLLSIRNHGSLEQYKHEYIGHNYRMSGFQGSILSVKLKYLDKWNEARISNAKVYNNLLKDIEQIQIPHYNNNVKHVFHQYVIKCQKRDLLKKYLQEHDIDSTIYYPIPCHLQAPYLDIESVNPISEQLSDEVLALPIAEHINEDNIKYISSIICRFYG